MHVIIDGYNLIRQSDELRRYERLSLEEARKALIRDLSLYKQRKGHKVTVVFDGWVGGPVEEERDRLLGMDIIYSRRGEKADEVIKRISQKSAEEIVVVTSDRDIADFVNRRRGTAISSHEFVRLLEKAKTSAIEETSNVAERFAEEDDDATEKRTGKKGSSRRPSRRKRSYMLKMRKL